jgi:hypothetical protein
LSGGDRSGRHVVLVLIAKKAQKIAPKFSDAAHQGFGEGPNDRVIDSVIAAPIHARNVLPNRDSGRGAVVSRMPAMAVLSAAGRSTARFIS